MAIQKVNITDVCSEIFAGGDAPKNRMSIEKTSEYTIPIYSNGEYRNGLYGYTDFARVSLPSITVSARGTIGYAVIRKEPFVPIVRLITVTPIPELIDIHYLYYAIKNFSFSGSGTSIPQLTVPMIKQCSFLLPTLDEQREIAVVLDKVSDLIAKRSQQLEKLDLLVKARFVEMFGDPVQNSLGLQTKSMPEICTIIDGDRGKNYPKQEEFSSEGHCLFLNAKNVTSTGFNFDICMYITEEKDNLLRNGKLQRGDVVLTTRGTLGNLAFYDYRVPFEHVRINSGMVILRMKQNIMSEIYFIEQFKLQLQSIKEKIASGSAQPQLPISTMNKIRILIAPMNLQNQFADFVEQTEKTKTSIRESLTKLETLKKTLMQEYFG